MSDRPESIPAPPASVPHDVGAHPIRELYLCHFREQDRPLLAAPLDLLLSVLLEGERLEAYLPNREHAGLLDEAAAAVRDLEFTAACLSRMSLGSALEYEDETLARFCRSVGQKVGATAATLAGFLSTWRGSELRP
jgi:hypothetical protein